MLAQTPEDQRHLADVLGFSPFILALYHRGYILSTMGRHDEAEAELDRAVRLARQHGDAENLAWSHAAYVWVAYFTGSTEAAPGHARRPD